MIETNKMIRHGAEMWKARGLGIEPKRSRSAKALPPAIDNIYFYFALALPHIGKSIIGPKEIVANVDGDRQSMASSRRKSYQPRMQATNVRAKIRE